jgi:hypothetical protein
MSEFTKRAKTGEFAKIAKSEGCENTHIPIGICVFAVLAACFHCRFVFEESGARCGGGGLPQDTPRTVPGITGLWDR